jgi:hypothetical protein
MALGGFKSSLSSNRGFVSPLYADQYDDSGQYLQCKLAAAVKLPLVTLPATWLLE